MTSLTMTNLPMLDSIFDKARTKFRSEFCKGIKPVDGRQPIPDELAQQMVQELIDYKVPKDALIGVVDAFLILSTHLKEMGFTNLILLENNHQNLTESQEKYYNNVKTLCEKSDIKYYVPPINNYSRCNMKFDVIIGNPPYQNNKKNGSGTGSGHSALYLKFVEVSHSLLKKDGILSLITPSAIFIGSDSKTKYVIGKKAIFSTKFIDFDINHYFNIGQDICRWVASIKKNAIITKIADGREVDLNNISFLVKNKTMSDIVQTLVSSNAEKFDFSFSGAYVFESIAAKLQKTGVKNAKKIASDKSQVKTESHPYAVDFNGKVSYVQIKPAKYDEIRLFAPQLTNPKDFKFVVRTECGNNGSTYTMTFNSIDEANKTADILNNPLYLWVINNLRVDARINKTFLNFLPNAPIESILSQDQISYIQSQL